MELSSGSRLGHFEIRDRLGEGGMGVVWKAVDTTLDREVAIKVLPDAFSQDAERLARFEREVKSLASLNHPNIAAIHSVHEAEGIRFLAMELVPGMDLHQRIAGGAVPIDEALEITSQIATALQAAHDGGIVHRDLKPANVKLTPGRKVKVLSFGLAKAWLSDPSISPTMTSAGTMIGTIIGTASYMSPEQARGRAVDPHRGGRDRRRTTARAFSRRPLRPGQPARVELRPDDRRTDHDRQGRPRDQPRSFRGRHRLAGRPRRSSGSAVAARPIGGLLHRRSRP